MKEGRDQSTQLFSDLQVQVLNGASISLTDALMDVNIAMAW
jgi:hypothetical protein